MKEATVEKAVLHFDSKRAFEAFRDENNTFFSLLFYKSGTVSGDNALKTLNEVKLKNPDIRAGAVDVSKIKDIHGDYQVTVSPTLIIVKKGKIVKKLEGVQNNVMYKQMFFDAPQGKSEDGKTAKRMRVVVYTTPTCPHCRSVKSYLRAHGIIFREVDVARDRAAGERLMNKSGSMGVPQTEINGQIVVGANLSRINELLDIKN